MLEASIEFGASVSIDLVVANANVHIMAGVLLKLDFARSSTRSSRAISAPAAPARCARAGHALGGVLSRLRLLSPPAARRLQDRRRASITVEVDVLMFSASVSLSAAARVHDPTNFVCRSDRARGLERVLRRVRRVGAKAMSIHCNADVDRAAQRLHGGRRSSSCRSISRRG